jgi:LETM1 and EF-hand domain-containing protein 1
VQLWQQSRCFGAATPPPHQQQQRASFASKTGVVATKKLPSPPPLSAPPAATSSAGGAGGAAPTPPQEVRRFVPGYEEEEKDQKLADRIAEAALKVPVVLRNGVFALGRGVKLCFTDPAAVRAWLAKLNVKFKAEVKHYWLGIKLLVADVQTAKKLLRKLAEGHSLTRRENKQLIRTGADIIRLVPMAIIVLIPALELALPILLKLFPNMLPSTFQDKLKAEENMKQQLKLRMALATYLQDTMQHMAKGMKQPNARGADGLESGGGGGDKDDVTPDELLSFMQKARRGEPIDTSEILRFAPLFGDDITLDNVPRPQLVAICSILGLRPFGADAFLRFQLRHKLRGLRADDKDILWEGLYTLDKRELRAACAERGMRAVGLTEAGYRRQMQQWLDLSLNKNIPLSFLIMSRAFTFTNYEAKEQEKEKKKEEEELLPAAPAAAAAAAKPKPTRQEREAEEQNEAAAAIASSISAIDDELLTEVLLEKTTKKDADKTTEVLDKVAMREMQLESLRFQNELIEDEERAVEEDKRALEEKEKEKKEKEKKEELELDASEPALWAVDVERLDEAGIEHDLGTEGGRAAVTEEAADADADAAAAAAAAVAAQPLVEGEEVWKEQQEGAYKPTSSKAITIDEIAALEALTHASPVELERSRLRVLKQQKEQLDVAALLAAGRIGHQTPAIDPKAPTTRVSKLMEKLIERIEHDMEEMEAKVGDSLHLLDTDNDGEISVDELESAVRALLRTRVTDEEVQQLVTELDADCDGKVSVQELAAMLDRLREDAGVDEHKALMTTEDEDEHGGKS